MIKEVKIQYDDANEKYYAFVDRELIGKFYTFEEVLKGLERHNERRIRR